MLERGEAERASMTKQKGRGEGAVFRRRVFYIPGYDPFHPRRYRELYRSEGAQQAGISGYTRRCCISNA